MQSKISRFEEEREQVEEKMHKPVRPRKLLPVVLLVCLAVLIITSGAVVIALRFGFLPSSPLFSRLLSGRLAAAEDIKEPAFMYAVPEILVNLPEGGRRFLSVKFYLGFDEPKLEKELEKRMPEVRDVVNRILWTKTASAIDTPEGKEELRAEILTAINALLHDGELRGLYFWHLLIQ